MKLCAVALIFLLPCLAALSGVDQAKASGNPSAPIAIEVFSDFECPSCKNFHDNTLPDLMREYVMTGKVYLVYRDFPLNMHRYSRVAAGYAVAAARVGAYQDVASALFHDQQSWALTGKVWETVAKVLTPSQQKKVQALANDPTVTNEIQSDINLGNSVQINETPTLLVIHGTRQIPIVGSMANYQLLRQLLNDLAQK